MTKRGARSAGVQTKDFSGSESPAVLMSPGWYRLGGRFRSVFTLVLPVIVLVAICVVVARFIVATPGWAAFASTYPCVPHLSGVPLDEPGWLRWLHYFNFLLLAVLIRSGIQILADHPRLYWTVHSTPGEEWLRFRGPVPTDRIWTSKDDSTYLGGFLGLPGGRHTVGLARKWHLGNVLLWVAVGFAFIVLLFVSDQWRKLVPTSWSLAPDAMTCAVTYASIHLSPGEGGAALNALQQLTYFVVVFIAAPLLILTGLAMSPALVNSAPWYQRLLGNHQAARSIHFLLWCFYLVFFVGHVAMVIITNLRGNMNLIVLGVENDTAWTGVILGAIGILFVIMVLVLANKITWRSPRALLHVYRRTVQPVMGALFDRLVPKAPFTRQDISPHFWPNGKMPTSVDYNRLNDADFRDYRLRVYGEVEHPAELSLEELRSMQRREQITLHHCIQGWSGIAQWAGVPMASIIELVRPRPSARYAIFYSFAEGGHGGQYYDAHDLAQMYNQTSILAYEMNDKPLSVLHGAPLRLRNESQLGFKHVKWVSAVEFIADYRTRFEGEGGYNEDHEYYGSKAEI